MSRTTLYITVALALVLAPIAHWQGDLLIIALAAILPFAEACRNDAHEGGAAAMEPRVIPPGS